MSTSSPSKTSLTTLSRKLITKTALLHLFNNSRFLRVLSFKFYAHLDLKDIFETLARSASPNHFVELYLDGCENIDDATLTPLVEEEGDGFKGL